MEELIWTLTAIDGNPVIEEKKHLTDGYHDKLHPTIQLAVSRANELLITDTGTCNWNNINILKESGYNVFPGEQDSFGWLIGCIRTKKGIIAYG